MNVFIIILLCFALLGAVDKVLGGRLGLAGGFDRGMGSMGSLCLSMMGIYCFGIMAIRGNMAFWQGLQARLPFDASLLLGSLLAPDMGGHAIAKELAANPATATFAGAIVSSTLGCTLSFVIPIFLGNLPREEILHVMNGLLRGIVVLPLGLTVGGLLLGLTGVALLSVLWPVLLLCFLLFLGLLFFPTGMAKGLMLFGNGIRILGIGLFCLAAAAVFFPVWELLDPSLIQEILEIVFRIAVIVAGSSVLSDLVLRWGKKPLAFLSRKLGINDYAVLGLVLSLATSVAILPLFGKMDEKGKLVNSAFAVSGAFVLGGQLAFIATVESPYNTTVYMIAKLVGGLAAVALVLLEKRIRKGRTNV